MSYEPFKKFIMVATNWNIPKGSVIELTGVREATGFKGYYVRRIHKNSIITDSTITLDKLNQGIINGDIVPYNDLTKELYEL